MSDEQRQAALEYRSLRRFPRHSPPHFDSDLDCQYLFNGACYEHSAIVGKSAERMAECEREILSICLKFCSAIYAWCFLPNHYHILLKTNRMKDLRTEIGLFNGRTSFTWNGEDDARGRKVWHNCFERKMRSERHYYATLNYVLHNPVHHGYVNRWDDWPWSNAKEYLENNGRENALKAWNEYPILDYGKKWDID